MANGAGFSVDRSSLIDQAVFWSMQALQMTDLRLQIQSVEWNGPRGSIFGPVIVAYQQATEHIAQLCLEGNVQMQSISSALTSAAGVYENNEHEIVTSLKTNLNF